MACTIDRRQALTIGAGAVALAAFGWPRLADTALAATNGFEDVIAEFAGGRTPEEGRVSLDLPQIADDGSAVLMTLAVDSPMTEDSHVTDVLVVADGNPRPGVATFHFSPASGVAEVSTRIRLAQTENVIAVAKMNDGSLFMAKRHVTVTVGGCAA